MRDKPPLVEITAMSKRFGALQALDRVSLALRPGAFHALLGENGAGKSTLVKCLMGYHSADEGSIRIDGHPVVISSPRDAHSHDLGMVYQHFTLVPSMTVAENLALTRPDLPLTINWKAERLQIDQFLERSPFRLDPDCVASDLAAGEKQKLEILKQLYLKRRVLILDEPTSVLTPAEADEVLGLLTGLCAEGEASVLLITHKLREVFAFTQSVTVLRRGRIVGEDDVSALNPRALAHMMVGEEQGRPEFESREDGTAVQPGPERLGIDTLAASDDRGRQAVRGVSLSVKAGETVGIAGVSGNGQRELIQALAGQRKMSTGRVLLNGRPFQPGQRQRGGLRLGIIPEEPRYNACAPELSLTDNLALNNFDRPPLSTRFGWLRHKQIRSYARHLIDQYSIRCPGPEALVAALSGGNVQRVVLARTLAASPEVLILANPCNGLDVAAVAEIHARIRSARAAGTAVLLISEDLDELLAISDRILVMFEGRVVLEVDANESARGLIGQAMAGVV